MFLRLFAMLPVLFLAAFSVQGTEVTGHTDKPVKEVVFLRRVEPKKFKADKYLPEAYSATVSKDGRSFSVKDLPAGSYDIRLRLQDGSIIEGVDLGKKDTPEDAGPLTEADVAALGDIITHLKTFFDRTRIFLVDGWRGMDDLGRQGYAWVLVEELRWRKTSFDRKRGSPFVVFRMDVWEFERMAGAWRKVKPYKVIYRLNVDVPDFERYKWYFTDSLAGFKVEGAKVDIGEIKVPEPDQEKGRVGFPESGREKPFGEQ